MKEYKVVFNLEGQPFDEMVSQCMNDGWQLYGNPWSHQEPEGGLVHLYQSITREVTVQYVMVEEDDENASKAESSEKKDEKKDDK
ncbi:MAG: DUF1737 domain-containing protein [Lentisphaeraceae bacterium]|nr:DUF1737 domain-containing protein [Lentisphaeraceae bacterium]